MNSNHKKRIVIIGATSYIAEHCARLWVAAEPADLILVGRNQTKLESIAVDLKVRSPQSNTECIESDFTDPAAITLTVDAIAQSGPIDIALIAHGSLADQQQSQDDLLVCHDSLIVNGTSPVLFAEAIAKHMEKENTGSLAIIGSVAGDRGRKSNYVYGAAKGLVSRYAQGLQHRLAKTNVTVTLIKPGPTDTPMTSHLKQEGASLADPKDVASQIVAGVKAGKSVVYAPTKWLLVMLIIRHLPAFIFNKMNI